MPDNSTGSKRRRTASQRTAGFGFNAKSREAQRWAKAYAGDRITNLNRETKINVRRMITESIRDGVPPRDSATLIREAVGLNRPQGIALRRYVRNLPPSLSTAAKAKAGIRLKKKMIRRRAITIARTEVIDSLSAGVEQSWAQAQGNGLLGKHAKKEWVTTPFGACAICRELNGSSVPLHDNFQSGLGPLARPTAHPNCRCGLAPVPGGGGALQPAALPPGVTQVTSIPLTADGLIIRGADARKAILDYADGPDSVYKKKLEKARKRYADESAKNKETLNNHLDDYQKLRKLEVEEEQFYEQFFAPEIREKVLRIDDRRLVDKRTGKLVSADDVSTRIKTLRSQKEAVQEQMQKLTASAYEAQQEIEMLTKGLHDEILEKFIYNKTRNMNVDVDVDPSLWDKTAIQRHAIQEKQALDEGLDAWRRMTDDDLYASIPEGEQLGVSAQKRAAQVKVNRVDGRASANTFQDRQYAVNLDLRDTSRGGRGTTVHEMTHTIEFGNPDVLAEAIRWRDLRTRGNTKRELSHWTDNDNYRPSEQAYDDKWKTQQNPDGVGNVYQGKTYSMEEDHLLLSVRQINDPKFHHAANKVFTERDGWQIGTEVSTMGMQEMYQNPVLFAKEQPELFDFVFERIIRRKYTHGTSRWSLRGNKDFRFAKEGELKTRRSWGHRELVDLVEEGKADHQKARYYYIDD